CNNFHFGLDNQRCFFILCRTKKFRFSDSYISYRTVKIKNNQVSNLPAMPSRGIAENDTGNGQLKTGKH
ncbi:MAG: hypothetical protein DRI57_24855, partial [Deltaproteobacteria bacterium]